MIIVIDNYDSFTYNLVHYLGELGALVTVYRNDAISVGDVMAQAPEAIVLSPGPATPDKAGICLDLTAKAAGNIPVLGVCLGHQTIAQVFGGKIIRASTQMHGKLSAIEHDNTGVFAGLESPFQATRYHSLIVEDTSVPDCLEVNAQTSDGVIMGLAHKEYMVHGVQFHPESIASENGHKLLKNFLDLAAAS